MARGSEVLFAVEAGSETAAEIADYLTRAGVPGLLTIETIGSVLRHLRTNGFVRYYTLDSKPTEYCYTVTAKGARKCSWWRGQGAEEP